MTRPRLTPDDLSNIEPIDNTHTGKCEACGDVTELEHYDNGILGPVGWLCFECIGTAEMEL